MRTIKRRVLAVCMAALLLIPSFAVLAEEMPEAETVNGVEIITDISGSEAAMEPEDAENAAEILEEDQIMVYADGDIGSGSRGDITWVIDASGKLTLTGTGDWPGGVNNWSWLTYDSQITSVEMNVTGMTDVSSWFGSCSNMTSIDMSGSDTSGVTNMSGMFNGCSSLTSLNMSGLDTSSVTDMSSMFNACSSLTSLDLSNLDTSSVTNMRGMFTGCSSLTSLNVSGFNTSNVTDMSSMFGDCRSLTSLDVSGLNTGNVTTMSAMFRDCSSLTSLVVNGLNTGNVTSMELMFARCSGLTSLDVSGLDTGNVTIMSGMFDGCSGLTSLDVSGLRTNKVENMNRMFRNCGSLVSLDLSGFDASSIDEMVDMLYGCDSLATLRTPYNCGANIDLPSGGWYLPDGTQIFYIAPSQSVTLTRNGTPTAPEIITTTPDLNMADVVRVKYVPYSYTVETDNTDAQNTITFSIEEGRLAEGLELYPATGEIYGVPLEAGEFPITVKATYSNPAYLPSYAELTLTVLDNTDANVDVATDDGYDITQPVTGFDMEVIAGSGAQTLVSQGEYSQFRDVYIDGRKLTEGQDYTSEAGSTRITILNQTLANDGTGTHTLGIEFRTEDGTLKRAAQNYVISKSASSGDDSDSDSDNDSGDGTDNDNSGGANTDNNDNSGSNTGDNGSSDNTGSNNSGNSNNNGNSNHSSNSNSSFLPTPAETPQQDFIIYTVERGDSLWKIAAKFYGQGSSWRIIYQDNAAAIKNPGRLYAGQRLIIRLTEMAVATYTPELTVSIPSTETLEGTAYRVQKGDRLWTIARRAYGSGRLWTIIYEANKDVIADPERIREGQVIAIPQR